MKKIYVGNLSWSTTSSDLESLFGEFGTVESAAVVMDRETGRSRGFGFIEMDDEGAEKAIQALDGKDLQGRDLRVNEARPREGGRPRGGGGGGRGRGGGGGGGRGGDRY